MDERRHNMDGALFVDDEQAEDGPPRARPRRDGDDEKAEDARRVTQGILDRMDLEARVTIREDEERVVLDIDGPDAGRAIGKKGMTLEALQFLVNKIVNRDPDERRHIVLDSGDYRDRHDSGLMAMAKREAKRAVTTGRPITLEPMSARDRRVIHVSLAKFPGVSTHSEGEGSDRRLQIIPARGARNDRDERPRERDRDRGARGPGPIPGRNDNRGGGGGGPRPVRERAPVAVDARGPARAQNNDDRAREPEFAPPPRDADRDFDEPERDYDNRR